MKHIDVAIDDGVGTLTINRRERFNSLDVETARELRKAGLQLARDTNVRVVILRGSGGVFCSGADLKDIRQRAPHPAFGHLVPPGEGSEDCTQRAKVTPTDSKDSPRVPMATAGSEDSALREPMDAAGDSAPRVNFSALSPRERVAEGRVRGSSYGESFKEILEYIHATISEIRRAAKPWIAAVDGVAAAGGFGLAMCCDLVIASERATFEWAYGKTGLTGAESSTFFLPRLLGMRRAMQLVLLNPRLDARTALEWELITTVVPTETFDDEVMKIARQIANGPTEALGIAKQLINQAAGVDRLDFHLDRELAALARIADGANFSEGIDAFFEKRAPRFAVK